MYVNHSQEEQPPRPLDILDYLRGIPDQPSNRPVLLDYLQVLRRRKWLILCCWLIVQIPVAIYIKFSTPIYEAAAAVIYEKPKGTMFVLDGQPPRYDRTALINLTEQLKSLALAEEVAKSLPQEVIQRFKLPKDLPPYFSKEKIIGQILRSKLSIVQVSYSDILEIKIQANNPTDAQVIANAYMEGIITWNLQRKREEISNVRDFVEKQLLVLQNKLNDTEEALRDFKEKNIMVSLSDASSEALKRLTQAEVSYNSTKAERVAMEQRLRSIERKIKKLAPSLSIIPRPSPMNSPRANILTLFGLMAARGVSAKSRGCTSPTLPASMIRTSSRFSRNME